MTWLLKSFRDLSPQELYAILQLRNRVFAVEQNCVYPDMDDRDQDAFHFMGWQEQQLMAYTRILPPGLAFPEASVGRVVTAAAVRGSGMGRELMERSIGHVYALFGRVPVKIGAQLYLEKFYSSLGFRKTSDVYLEDGIEHITMLLV